MVRFDRLWHYGVVAGNSLAAGGPYRYRADLATRATSGSAQLRPFWRRSLVTIGYVVLLVLIGIVIALVATVDELSSR
jgi:hypothetical protein